MAVQMMGEEAFKEVAVAAAIICRDGRILAAHRPTSATGAGWEFPGGKLHAGETADQAVRREIEEELGLPLSTTWLLDTVRHDYPTFRLVMDCFVCMPLPGAEPVATEHDELRWLARDELASVAWLPADVKVATLLGAWWDQVFESEHL